MDWTHFRKEPDGFSLKRLPTITNPVRIKDVTDLNHDRSECRGLSFSEGVDWYQHWFDTYQLYDVEIDTFDEAADRASASFLQGMAPFKGHMADAGWLMEESEPIELGLSAPAIKKAEAAGLITGDVDNGYQAGPKLASEIMSLIQRMIEGVYEATRDLPKPYQEAVWHELAGWDGLPLALARQAVRAYGGPIGLRVAEEAQAEADSYVPGSEYGPPHFDPPLELHFRYQGTKDSYPKQRRAAIHHIVGVHQAYLKGTCLDSNEERSFLGHRIEGEILDSRTGEVIPVDRNTTSQQLREALSARRTTEDPSGVAPRVPPQKASTTTPTTPHRSPKQSKALRNPVLWLLGGAIVVWWLMLR